MIFKDISYRVLSVIWIFTVVCGMPVKVRSDDTQTGIVLDYAVYLIKFMYENYRGRQFNLNDPITDYVISKGCSYIAG